jgi:hypothetical protein
VEKVKEIKNYLLDEPSVKKDSNAKSIQAKRDARDAKEARKDVSIEVMMDNIGLKRVYNLDKRSKQIHAYFNAAKDEKKYKIKATYDYIFNGAEHPAELKNIANEFAKVERDIDAKINRYVKKHKK